MLWNLMIVDGVGRFLGPPLARLQTAAQGQTGYAAQQLILLFSSFLVIELAILPVQRQMAR